jgi:hypothetical protein
LIAVQDLDLFVGIGGAVYKDLQVTIEANEAGSFIFGARVNGTLQDIYDWEYSLNSFPTATVQAGYETALPAGAFGGRVFRYQIPVSGRISSFVYDFGPIPGYDGIRDVETRDPCDNRPPGGAP